MLKACARGGFLSHCDLVTFTFTKCDLNPDYTRLLAMLWTLSSGEVEQWFEGSLLLCFMQSSMFYMLRQLVQFCTWFVSIFCPNHKKGKVTYDLNLFDFLSHQLNLTKQTLVLWGLFRCVYWRSPSCDCVFRPRLEQYKPRGSDLWWVLFCTSESRPTHLHC